MFFSPVAERSAKVQALYLSFYGILAIGAVTMILPFVIMLSGSVEPGLRFTDARFFPNYLISGDSLWKRYLEAKYRNESDLFRMSHGSAEADLGTPSDPVSDPPSVALWKQFLEETEVPAILFATGFSGAGGRIPFYYNRKFRQWLSRGHESIQSLNASLGSTFPSLQVIMPPNITLTGGRLNRTPVVEKFLEFSKAEVLLVAENWIGDVARMISNVQPPALGWLVRSENCLEPGLDYRPEQLGHVAVEMVVAQIHRNDRGSPIIPHTVLLDAVWIDARENPLHKRLPMRAGRWYGFARPLSICSGKS